MDEYTAGRKQIVGLQERWASGLLGGMLTLAGLRRRGLIGLGAAAVGGVLIKRAITGYCEVYDALGLDSTAEGRAAERDRERRDAAVDTTSEDSFPASDAPAWTPVVSTEGS